jgi:hypothetical protein
MGMYDTVNIPCPKCETLNEFQSKGGDCLLSCYTLEDVPNDVLLDINRHSPITCRNCNTKYEVGLIVKIITCVREVPL